MRVRSRTTVRRMPDDREAATLPPGSKVRFRVADVGGLVGSSWSVKTAQLLGDVYVTHREGGRWLHTSLHRDGRWHFAVTSAGQELDPDGPRYLAVSTEHHEISPGWLHAMRITVAASELRGRWNEKGRARELVEITVPAGVDAVLIDVLLGSSARTPLPLHDASIIARMERGDGGMAVIAARAAVLDGPVHTVLGPQIAAALADLRAYGWDGLSGTRIVIFGDNAEGFLQQVEVAVDAEADK